MILLRLRSRRYSGATRYFRDRTFYGPSAFLSSRFSFIWWGASAPSRPFMECPIRLLPPAVRIVLGFIATFEEPCFGVPLCFFFGLVLSLSFSCTFVRPVNSAVHTGLSCLSVRLFETFCFVDVDRFVACLRYIFRFSVVLRFILFALQKEPNKRTRARRRFMFFPSLLKKLALFRIPLRLCTLFSPACVSLNVFLCW